MEDAAEAERARIEGKADHNAEIHYRKKLVELQKRCMLAWRAHASQELAHRAYLKEVEDMQNQHREAGDRTAEMMAERFANEHKRKLLVEVITEWHKEAI